MTGWTTLRAVFANELRALWLSPLGWGFVGTALLLGGWLLQLSLASTGEASLRGWLPNFAVTLLFCMPLLTMRTVAGERRRGTLELLMSAPVSLGSVIVGKWLGVVATCALMLVLTTPFAAALAWVGDPDWGTVLTTYLGLAACCGLFAAVGIFASASGPRAHGGWVDHRRAPAADVARGGRRPTRFGARPSRLGAGFAGRSPALVRPWRARQWRCGLVRRVHILVPVLCVAGPGGATMALIRRRWAVALNAGLTVVLVTGAAVLGVGVAEQRAVRWDLTEGARASLAPETASALASAREAEVDISVTAFTTQPRDEDAWLRNRTIRDFLATLADASPAVTARTVDFDRERGVAVQYGVERYGTVVVEGRGRRVDLSARDVFRTRGRGDQRSFEFVGEGAIAAAVRRLLRDHDARVGILEGHGERRLPIRGPGELTRFASLLQDQGIAVEPLTLAGASQVPVELDAVLVLAPSVPVAAPEMSALAAFVAQGEPVGWFVEPGGSAPSAWGVQVDAGVVHDVVSYFPYADRPLLSHGAHPITDALRDAGLNTVVAGAAPVRAEAGTALLHTGSGGTVVSQDGERAAGTISVAVALSGDGAGRRGGGGGRRLDRGRADGQWSGPTRPLPPTSYAGWSGRTMRWPGWGGRCASGRWPWGPGIGRSCGGPW